VDFYLRKKIKINDLTEKEYWLNKWRSNDIAFHEQDINPDLIAYIHTLNLYSGDYIFVPLCGKTKDMVWLANEGFHVIGVELSPIACDEFFSEMNISPQITQQSKFIRYKHNNIELLCGDLFDLTKTDLPTIHAIYDCKALIALPNDLRKKYVNHIMSCLGTKIKILLLTMESNCHVKPPPYSVNSNEIDLLYGNYFNVQLLKSESIRDIPERLVKKGYLEMRESVYLISELRGQVLTDNNSERS
jgi:thiopurine S-methyltransferase